MSSDLEKFWKMAFYARLDGLPEKRGDRFGNNITSHAWLKSCLPTESKPFSPYKPMLQEVYDPITRANTIELSGFCDAAHNYYCKRATHVAGTPKAIELCENGKSAATVSTALRGVPLQLWTQKT